MRRAVRGNYLCKDNLSGTRRKPFEVVLRGLDPRIHVFVLSARRRGWPGQARPRRSAAADFPPFAPDGPARKRERRGGKGRNGCPLFKPGAGSGPLPPRGATIHGQLMAGPERRQSV